MKKQNNVETVRALSNFPYFVLKEEIKTGYNLYTQELIEIKQNYIDYKHGCEFKTEGTSGDYIASNVRFKEASYLINKEARYMFSQTPDVTISANGLDEQSEEVEQQYQKLINEVLKQNNFSKLLLQSAKDCFIGKRVACLVDYSEDDGIQLHFYNSLQFYYETDYGSERLTKFISFEQINNTKTTSQRLYLINRYEEINGDIYLSSILKDGLGNENEVLIENQKTELKQIPVVIIVNDGTLDEKGGVSEMSELSDYESGYSRLSNSDIDSERKGMNPIRYVVDMNPKTTGGLSSSAGSFWDLEHNQNMNDPKPSIGILAPALNHTEAVKSTLNRIKTSMHNAVDVPDISQEGLLSGITSFKALKALYFPLTVRCNEKLKTWKPAIEFIVKQIIQLALLNKNDIISRYVLTGLDELQYNINVVENYALIDDETEEKEIDLAEIAQNTRSRKSYIKKWRSDEFKTDEQIERELMQIALEVNMFDTMSINTQIQGELNKQETQKQIDDDIELQQAEQNLEK